MGQDPTQAQSDISTEVPTRSGPWNRVRLTYATVRANPLGDLAVKIFIAVLGGLIVAVGIALIPLPGPGWLIVILGLTVLAIEFVWARHLLRYAKEKLRAWTHWMGRQSMIVRILIGSAGLIFIGTVFLLTLKFSFGVDAWNYVTTH